MVRTPSPADRRAELDRRLESVLADTDGTSLELARAGVLDAPDRWYGQLVALSHEAVANGQSGASPATNPSASNVLLPVSTAVELLRGYCRLRGELFVQPGTDDAHSLPPDHSAAILAGDHLNSSAYAVLGSVDHPRLGEAFETLLSVSESLACAFDAGPGESVEAHCSFLDETVGSLGEGTAVIGATLAGAGDSTRERVGTLGRGFSTARQIQQCLDLEGETRSILPTEAGTAQLREYGTRQLAAANRALDDLAASADVTSLRGFVEDALPTFDPIV